jgi:hypothetical protein
MRNILFFSMLIAFSGASEAQTVQRIDIIEYGIYTATRDKVVEQPATATGTSGLVSNIKLVRQTDTIPARLGVRFGFRFKIAGTPNAVVKLKKITRVPSPGITNPKTGNVTMTSVYSSDRTIGGINYTDYSFDDAWEIAPGTWTIELWDGDRKLASQSFNVVKE